jgi:signal transduction histidine kinase
MPNRDQALIREQLGSHYLNLISVLGLIILLVSLFNLQPPVEWLTFLLLILFIGISEYFPVPIWKGSSALSFPLVYTLVFLYGLPSTVVVYGLIVFVVNALQDRPLRLLAFTPAQLMISLAGANLITQTILSSLLIPIYDPLYNKLVAVSLFTFFYYIINNLIVDLLLWIRPQPYTWVHWRLKTFPETIVAVISLGYLALMFFLSHQNHRGTIDVISYLFFFSPLVALSLISSIIGRLQKERNRLKALFSITTEFNRMIPTGEIQNIKVLLRDFLGVQASALWIKTDGEWRVYYTDGRINHVGVIPTEIKDYFEDMKRIQMLGNRNLYNGPAAIYFDERIRSFVFAPLIVDNETVGMFAVGRIRTQSFMDDDIQSIATVVNQLAVLFKTRMLFSEKERRLILEERNRIGREIHDGLAQSLAGAILKLESAQKMHTQKPEQAMLHTDDGIRKLRSSLKEVRQSIYALRPYPTEEVGLKQAMKKKMVSFEQEYGLKINLQERGKETQLSPMVEKVLFDVFQESLRNVAKHAQARHVEILLSYQSEHLLFKIKDDGIGFSLVDAMIKAKKEPHYGILNMNEQADKLGASLHVDSSVGKGTEIKLIIPNLEVREGFENDSGDVGR